MADYLAYYFVMKHIFLKYLKCCLADYVKKKIIKTMIDESVQLLKMVSLNFLYNF